MRIVTTFDDALYEGSGRALLASLAEHVPDAELLVYSELTRHSLDVPSVAVVELPTFSAVQRACADIIPPNMGGRGCDLEGFNRRWFGWFRKVVAQRDAMVERPHAGLTVFLDSDVRALRPFTEAGLRDLIGGRGAVGVMRGDRLAIEAGVVVYDGVQPEAAQFAERFYRTFATGAFRRLSRWDDGYVMTYCMARNRGIVFDFADGVRAGEHENSNGHRTSGQVLPFCPLGRYFEHDKGAHWRAGLADFAADHREPRARPGSSWARRLLTALR